MEFLIKEIRNGDIYYWVNGGNAWDSVAVGPCGAPSSSLPPSANTYPGPSSLQKGKSNRLGLVNAQGIVECIYLGDAGGVALASNIFSVANGTLVLDNRNGAHEIITPSNLKVESLVFYIRPTCDPYTPTCSDYGSDFPKMKPFVQISAKFSLILPTGDKSVLYYQTAVSNNDNDIPN
jgi:hypothetical protein